MLFAIARAGTTSARCIDEPQRSVIADRALVQLTSRLRIQRSDGVRLAPVIHRGNEFAEGIGLLLGHAQILTVTVSLSTISLCRVVRREARAFLLRSFRRARHSGGLAHGVPSEVLFRPQRIPPFPLPAFHYV